MAAVVKTIALPIVLPVALTVVLTQVPMFANFLEQSLGVSKLPKGFSFFTSKQGWAGFGLLFTVMFLLTQLVILPLTPVGPSMGKLTKISPKQVPAIVFKLFLFGYLPLVIANMFVGLSGEKDENKKLTIKRLGLLVGFFLVTFLIQVVPIADIFLTIILYMTLTSKGVMDKMLKVFGASEFFKATPAAKPAASPAASPAAGGRTAFAHFMIFLFLFGLVSTAARYLPFHDKLVEMVNARIGLFGESAKGFVNYGLNVALLLLLPMAIGNSLESVTQKMGTLKRGEGLNIGYIIGVMTGLLIQNITGKTVQLS